MSDYTRQFLKSKFPSMDVSELSDTDLQNLAFSASIDTIAKSNNSVASSIAQELKDQRSSLKLIASENYADPEVLLAMGNWMSDKYAEGIPGARYYAGCKNVDEVETLAVEYAKELFDADHAYVQPHSGIDANMVAFWSILVNKVQNPAMERLGVDNVDKISEKDWDELRLEMQNQKLMGLSLDSGGHLTHGFRRNISGKLFKQSLYGVDPETNQLNYDQIREQAIAEKPLILLAGFSAYPRFVNFRKFREIADEVGAVLMVDMAHFAGLVAGKVWTGDYNPVAFADVVTSTTHKSLRGPRGGLVLCTNEYKETVDKGCPMVLGGPIENVIAAKAVAFHKALQPEFKVYSQKVVDNSKALANKLQSLGVDLMCDGTDNHLSVIDTNSYDLTGRQSESALLESGIVTNRNSIPNDPNGPWYASGVRVGTPALTTRGLGEAEFEEVAELIHFVLTNTHSVDGSKAKYNLDESVKAESKKRIEELLSQFPLYEGILEDA